MSSIAVNAITDANAGNTATINAVTPNVNNVVGKNRIINGNMMIDQRNAGASVTQTTSVTYTTDRWNIYGTVAGKFTAEQNAASVTPPAGFANYLGMTSSSAYTVGAAETFQLQQQIEGFNSSDLAWGTASAKTVTLSFWVYSSLTGTFGGSLSNSTVAYAHPFSYSIPTANTWTQISITITGPTAGTWIGATNGIGVRVYFGLGVGSTLSGTAGAWAAADYRSATGATSVVGTSGATFYITGVQLEAGSSATEFEHRPYGTELALCQRYGFAVNGCYTGFANGTTTVDVACMYPVTMRANPTLTAGTAVMTAYGTGGSFTQSSVNSALPTGTTQNGCGLRFSNFVGLTANSVYVVNNAATGTVTAYSSFLSAEL